ncbi:hypothetical protein GCM10007919_15810 [Rhizobium indigoferae]|nr:hypothetical protein GCM10007919_15810 [Rhizobium indigoferae]
MVPERLDEAPVPSAAASDPEEPNDDFSAKNVSEVYVQMIRIFLSLFLTAGLTGCASASHPLPKCDGYLRRPLNRAMWQWEDDKPAKQSGSVPATAAGQATSYSEEPLTEEPAAFAHFDAVGSYRPCRGR